MHGPIIGVFVAGFGAVAALLVVGGAVLLRWQRAKLRQGLMLAALEKGVTAFPGMPPSWLASLRQGTSILVLGLLLMLVGAAMTGPANKLPMTPPAPTTQAMVDASAPDPQEFSPDGHRRPAPPPPETPAMRQWHQAQDQKSLGLVGVVCGLVLSALGLVRVVFARLERKYARAAGLSA